MGIERDELADATWEWLNQIRSLVNTDSPTLIQKISGLETWKINEDESFQKYQFRFMYTSNSDEIFFAQNPLWRIVKNIASSDSNIMKYVGTQIRFGTFSFRRFFSLDDYFRYILPKLIILNEQRCGLQMLNFEDVCVFLKELRSDSFTMTDIWPVQGLRTIEPLILESGLEFRKLKLIERRMMLTSGRIQTRGQDNVPCDSTDWFALVKTRLVKKIFDNIDFEHEKRKNINDNSLINDFLAAMYIVTEKIRNGIDSSHLQIEANLLNDSFSINLFDRSLFIINPNLDPQLTNLMKEDICFLWSVLRTPDQKNSNNNKKTLAIAIRRLYYAETRSKIEDKVVDIMIAAESIFIADGGSEKQFRVALTAAKWICSDNRDKNYQYFKEAYNIRSKIVHGQSVDTDKIVETYNKIKLLMMSAVKKLINLQKNGEKWPNWDKVILDL